MRDGLEEWIFGEKLKQLYKLLPVGFVATFVNSTVIAVVLYPITPVILILIWFLLQILSVALRAVLYSFGFRHVMRGENLSFWAAVLIIGFGISALIWGSAAFFMLSHRSPPHIMFVAFILGGMAAGSAVTFSALRTTHYIFSIPVILPQIVLFIFSGKSVYMAMGGLMAYFWGLISISAEMNRRVMHRSFQLRFENEKLVSSLRDSHDELERRVARRTEELRETNTRLEEANRELTYFSHSVSHDLRSPLYSIEGFSRVLEEDYGSSISEEAKNYLGLIRKAVKRMSELIEDLMVFARATQIDLDLKEVDLSELVVTISGNLFARDPKRSVEFVIPPGIKALCDPKMITIVLENLLGNAWKFTSKIDNAKIEFGVLQDELVRVYYVSDNGAGFDMALREKLFSPFLRLHKDSDFPGSGVGLATVWRIIKRHGGNVWAESQEGKGAIFFFTLKQ